MDTAIDFFSSFERPVRSVLWGEREKERRRQMMSLVRHLLYVWREARGGGEGQTWRRSTFRSHVLDLKKVRGGIKKGRISTNHVKYAATLGWGQAGKAHRKAPWLLYAQKTERKWTDTFFCHRCWRRTKCPPPTPLLPFPPFFTPFRKKGETCYFHALALPLG